MIPLTRYAPHMANESTSQQIVSESINPLSGSLPSLPSSSWSLLKRVEAWRGLADFLLAQLSALAHEQLTQETDAETRADALKELVTVAQRLYALHKGLFDGIAESDEFADLRPAEENLARNIDELRRLLAAKNPNAPSP